MKAKELRIGNYVSDCHASETFYAEVKKLDYSRCYYGQFHSAYSDLKPIKLTEEWLIKFGFRKINHENGAIDYKHNKYSISLHGNSLYVMYRDCYPEQSELISYFSYVHQLQNLYFALTGEELTIK